MMARVGFVNPASGQHKFHKFSPPAGLEPATHSLAYLTRFPEPHLLPKRCVDGLDYILDISV